MAQYSLQDIVKALELARETEVIQAAKEFYRDNGYKFSDLGKQQALEDLNSTDQPTSVKLSVGMALATLSLEELRGA